MNRMHPRLLLLELNEVNFEMVDAYASDGLLPNFRKLFENHGYCETTSETKYENLEPWIQWVTAHTGLTFEQHGVFRLGDIVDHHHEQIWERLERRHGIKTGALSPMNATNRCENSAFFLPDPWTNTDAHASAPAKRLYEAVRAMVNQNSHASLSLPIATALAEGVLRFASPSDYPTYLQQLTKSLNEPWRRALILDQLLTDLFRGLVTRTKPGFASLFLNAAAHIQHHYFFDSDMYRGEHKNPAWYAASANDPLLAVYFLYDRFIGKLRKTFPRTRIMLATALHQVPYPDVAHYWRLRNHEEFLRRHEVEFRAVEPRMSRDFLIECENPDQADSAARKLASATDANGTALFQLDVRGESIFATLAYAGPIQENFPWQIDGMPKIGFDEDVAFVAIKNGEHDGAGYFADTGEQHLGSEEPFPLTELPMRIESALA